MFHKAVRTDVKLRIGLAGPSGSGKTYSALRIAMALAAAHPPTRGPGSGRVAVLDTERDSAQLYADEQTEDGALDFDVAKLDDFRPQTFTRAIKEATKAGYPVIVIDSLSHAWEGILDLKDATGSGFDAWKKVTPVHNELVDLILRYPGHVIACARVKTEYVVEQVERNGRTQNVPRKVGLAPVARAGMEYEFTVFGDLEPGTNTLTISKTRCSALSGRTWPKPGADFAGVLIDWLAGAHPEPERVPEPQRPVEQPSRQPAPTGHHPSWDADRSRTAALLNTVALSIDAASTLLESLPKPRPRLASMDQATRDKALGWLTGPGAIQQIADFRDSDLGRASALADAVGEVRAAKACAAAGVGDAPLHTLDPEPLRALLEALDHQRAELEQGRAERWSAQLLKAGLDEEPVTAWAVAQGIGEPLRATQAARKALLADLTGEGRAAYEDWLDGWREQRAEGAP